ncbi:TIGR03086 family metal-binding protein [Aeromicrobium terrae]|uniref:TIGR03086 family protein n=1 Tax=Aeromicrobium terrae TaxID=2498846 RepID=A0A5C8NF73_9ACTN|nr:TIGR03086 family metal-binding protein [Aeromicrobium terrae]TXL57621.1 TIGR03086 family protein [Aeromicrobium terrae]
MALSEAPAERHREVAGVFAERVRGARDWEAPAPVEGWTARDVVRHLVEWFPSFLRDGGVELGAVPSVDDDPVAAWDAHAAAVQALLYASDADRPFTHPRAGSHRLSAAIDAFYTSDVFMHTWDLARATGQDETLDADEAERMLAGMQPIDEMLRASGQYGAKVPVPDDAPAHERLVGFIGRDPAWRP